jgi:cysteine desulfurase
MHYLDHAATTPVLPEVQEAMLRILAEDFGNPSSAHAFGRRAKEAVEDARDRVAAAIGTSPAEVVFTGGGTEADNLAIKGAIHKRRGNGNHVVVPAFEHHAVLDTAEWLHKQGMEVTFLGVPDTGVLDPGEVAAAVRSDTLLVSVMTVNNELGTVQPIAEIAAAAKSKNPNVVVHTDAVQALGNMEVDVSGWGVDLAAFAAHKLGGPKGVGALSVRSTVPVEAVIHGGGQERGMRSGTLNVAGIAGMGIAAEIAAREVTEKVERVTALRERLWAGIRSAVDRVTLNGDAEKRIPGTLNVAFEGVEAETLLLLLDQRGIACSAGSACQSGAIDPSHVLKAMGVRRDLALGSLRFSLGRTSTQDDVDALIAVLPECVATARRVA